MLTAQTFGRGIQLMNSVCHTQIKTDDTTNVYYMSLKDEVEDQEYLDAIMYLIKTKQNVYTPFSPAEILSTVKNKRKKGISIFDLIKLDIIKNGNKERRYKKEIQDVIEELGGLDYICSVDVENEKEVKRIENSFSRIKNEDVFLLKDNKVLLK